MFVKKIPLFLFLGFLVISCDSTEPGTGGPGIGELITDVTISLQAEGEDAIVATATDPDGDGADFMIEDLSINRNTVYVGKIIIEDNINNLNITNEVRNDAEEYQIHYLPESSLAITAVVTDEDANGQPVGLEFTLTTGDATSGNLRVVLSHYDDSPKGGPTLPDESDLDLNFPVVVGGVVGGG